MSKYKLSLASTYKIGDKDHYGIYLAEDTISRENFTPSKFIFQLGSINQIAGWTFTDRCFIKSNEINSFILDSASMSMTAKELVDGVSEVIWELKGDGSCTFGKGALTFTKDPNGIWKMKFTESNLHEETKLFLTNLTPDWVKNWSTDGGKTQISVSSVQSPAGMFGTFNDSDSTTFSGVMLGDWSNLRSEDPEYQYFCNKGITGWKNGELVFQLDCDASKIGGFRFDEFHLYTGEGMNHQPNSNYYSGGICICSGEEDGNDKSNTDIIQPGIYTKNASLIAGKGDDDGGIYATAGKISGWELKNGTETVELILDSAGTKDSIDLSKSLKTTDGSFIFSNPNSKFLLTSGVKVKTKGGAISTSVDLYNVNLVLNGTSSSAFDTTLAYIDVPSYKRQWKSFSSSLSRITTKDHGLVVNNGDVSFNGHLYAGEVTIGSRRTAIITLIKSNTREISSDKPSYCSADTDLIYDGTHIKYDYYHMLGSDYKLNGTWYSAKAVLANELRMYDVIIFDHGDSYNHDLENPSKGLNYKDPVIILPFLKHDSTNGILSYYMGVGNGSTFNEDEIEYRKFTDPGGTKKDNGLYSSSNWSRLSYSRNSSLYESFGCGKQITLVNNSNTNINVFVGQMKSRNTKVANINDTGDLASSSRTGFSTYHYRNVVLRPGRVMRCNLLGGYPLRRILSNYNLVMHSSSNCNFKNNGAGLDPDFCNEMTQVSQGTTTNTYKFVSPTFYNDLYNQIYYWSVDADITEYYV